MINNENEQKRYSSLNERIQEMDNIREAAWQIQN